VSNKELIENAKILADPKSSFDIPRVAKVTLQRMLVALEAAESLTTPVAGEPEWEVQEAVRVEMSRGCYETQKGGRPYSDQAERIMKVILAAGYRREPESPTTVEWCVYESATGVAWKVAPPTEREALAEAFMAGIGHDAIPLHLAGRLSNAFAHGRMWGGASSGSRASRALGTAGRSHRVADHC